MYSAKTSASNPASAAEISRVASDLRSVGVPRRSRTCTSLLVRALVSFAAVVFVIPASLKLFPPQSAGVDRIAEYAITGLRRASASTDRRTHRRPVPADRLLPAACVNAVNHRKVPVQIQTREIRVIWLGFHEREPRACRDFYCRRSTIISLMWMIALAGFRPLGQVCAQFMMVWQR